MRDRDENIVFVVYLKHSSGDVLGVFELEADAHEFVRELGKQDGIDWQEYELKPWRVQYNYLE